MLHIFNRNVIGLKKTYLIFKLKKKLKKKKNNISTIQIQRKSTISNEYSIFMSSILNFFSMIVDFFITFVLIYLILYLIEYFFYLNGLLFMNDFHIDCINFNHDFNFYEYLLFIFPIVFFKIFDRIF
jgi:hypothetical protein